LSGPGLDFAWNSAASIGTSDVFVEIVVKVVEE